MTKHLFKVITMQRIGLRSRTQFEEQTSIKKEMSNGAVTAVNEHSVNYRSQKGDTLW